MGPTQTKGPATVTGTTVISDKFLRYGPSTVAHPTVELRWNKGILEQKWRVVTDNGSGWAIEECEEWRPIPQA